MKINALFLAVLGAAMTLLTTPLARAEVKLGFLGGFTGAIESLTPPIYDGFRFAIAQINQQGGTSSGNISFVTADTTCTDATIAANSADRLVNVENVDAIVGALCSGATMAAANLTVPGNKLLISPASTAPRIGDLNDGDTVFRSAVSDASQGLALAKLLISKGIRDTAVTYVNNDYGKQFNDFFVEAFEGLGGLVTLSLAHEDNKVDYRGELGTLESAGSTNLTVIAYADSSGGVILTQAIENGFFTQFIGGDGMVSDDLVERIGANNLGDMIATQTGSVEFPGKEAFQSVAAASDVDMNAIYAAQSYDAAFLLALAIEKNGTSSAFTLNQALRSVSSPPGVVIYPGEWSKARQLILDGKDIDYFGSSGNLNFDAKGDVGGIIVELAIEGNTFVEVGLIE